jgi:hypothetical protein
MSPHAVTDEDKIVFCIYQEGVFVATANQTAVRLAEDRNPYAQKLSISIMPIPTVSEIIYNLRNGNNKKTVK